MFCTSARPSDERISQIHATFAATFSDRDLRSIRQPRLLPVPLGPVFRALVTFGRHLQNVSPTQAGTLSACPRRVPSTRNDVPGASPTFEEDLWNECVACTMVDGGWGP